MPSLIPIRNRYYVALTTMRDCIKAPYFTKNKIGETSLRKVRATAKKVNGKSRIYFDV